MKAAVAGWLQSALAELLAAPVLGSVAYLRELPGWLQAELMDQVGGELGGWQVRWVRGDSDPGRFCIQADQAVQLREDKGPALCLVIDPERSGAGLDGIYSAAREIGERDLADRACGCILRELPAPQRRSAERAVREANRLGGRRRKELLSPWSRVRFYAACLRDPGAALSELGLWPVALAELGGPEQLGGWLERARRMSELLLLPERQVSAPARVDRLLLPDLSLRPALLLVAELAQRQGAASALEQVLQQPELYLGRLNPGIFSQSVQRTELLPWEVKGKLAKWSGLREGEGYPVWQVDRQGETKRGSGKLTIRWKAYPEVETGSARYGIDLYAELAGEEVILASKEVIHKNQPFQSVAFYGSDLDLPGEDPSSVYTLAKVRLSCGALPPQESEELMVQSGDVQVGSSSGTRRARTLIEGLLASGLSMDELPSYAGASAGGKVRLDVNGHDLVVPGGQRRKVKVPRSPLQCQIETSWKEKNWAPLRWKLRVRGDGQPAGDLEPVPLPGVSGTRLEQTAKDLARFGDLGVLSALMLESFDPDTYLNAWIEAYGDGSRDPELALAHTLEVSDLSGAFLGLIVLPSHPLRLAWLEAYQRLWAEAERGIPGLLREFSEPFSNQAVPWLLPGPRSKVLVYGGNLDFHTVAMLDPDDPDPRSTLATLSRLWQNGSLRDDRAEDQGDDPTQKILAAQLSAYWHAHPAYSLLKIRAEGAGDGKLLARALGKTLQEASGTDLDGEAEPQRAYDLSLLLTGPRDSRTGSYLDEVASRQRAGQSVAPLDRWMLENTKARIPRPQLRWSLRDSLDSAAGSHLAVIFRAFALEVVIRPRAELASGPPSPYWVYGLLPGQRSRAVGEGWEFYLPTEQERPKHPAGARFTDRLARLQTKLMELVAVQLGGNPASDWPALRVSVPQQTARHLEELHQQSDWVVLLDHYAQAAYFDDPARYPEIYRRYIVSMETESSDLSRLQLITSTEQRGSSQERLRAQLLAAGLPSTQAAADALLEQLKSLSGRLAMRLGEDFPGGALRVISLAVFRLLACRGVFPGISLRRGVLVPTWDFPESWEFPEGPDTALLYLEPLSRPRRLQVWPLLVGSEPNLRRVHSAARQQSQDKQREQVVGWLQRWLREDWLQEDPVGGALRRALLVRNWTWQRERALARGFEAGDFEAALAELGRESSGSDLQIEAGKFLCAVFCPDQWAEQPVELEQKRYLFGGAALRDPDLLGDEQALDPPDALGPKGGSGAGELAPAALFAGEEDGRESRAGASPAGPEESGIPANPGGAAGLEPQETRVLLGEDRSGQAVFWEPSVRGSPHLLVLGQSGTGKTTAILQCCKQLERQGVHPIVFSYHQDLDGQLEAEFGDGGAVSKIGLSGLGFNPMRLVSASDLADVDNAGSLRDAFAAIYPDLGQLQLQQIREKLLESYRSNPDPTPPPFRRFYDLLQRDSKTDSRLMTRLGELADYGFFDAPAGQPASLLDRQGVTLIQLHRTTNESLQRAFAIFLLHRLYGDMLLRGITGRITHAVIFDEARRAARPKLLLTLLQEARKYGLTLLLASQQLDDFDPRVPEAIASKLIFRLGAHEAPKVARALDPRERVRDLHASIAGLSTGEAFFTPEAGSPRRLRTIGP